MSASNAAAHRVNTVLQRMTAPPELVLDHLKRIGVEPIVDQFQLDGLRPKVYVLIDYEELMAKELENISSGGELKDCYPAGFKSPESPNKNSNTPIIVEELRRRMDAAMLNQKVHLDEPDDDWPIVGEVPDISSEGN